MLLLRKVHSRFQNLYPIFYTLYPILYTPYPIPHIPYTPYPIPYTLYPILYTPYHIPHTLYAASGCRPTRAPPQFDHVAHAISSAHCATSTDAAHACSCLRCALHTACPQCTRYQSRLGRILVAPLLACCPHVHSDVPNPAAAHRVGGCRTPASRALSPPSCRS